MIPNAPLTGAKPKGATGVVLPTTTGAKPTIEPVLPPLSLSAPLDPELEAKLVAQSKMPKQMDGKVDVNAAHRLFALVVLRSVEVNGDYLQKGAKIIVFRSEGNGAAPVVAIAGPVFDPKQPVIMHTHFHGHAGTVAEHLGDPGRMTIRIREIQAQNKQVLFIQPEASDVGEKTLRRGEWDTPSNSPHFPNTSDLPAIVADAKAAFHVEKVDKRVVSANSGGGAALISLLTTKGKYDPAKADKLQADTIELSDCLYGCQDTLAAWAKSAQGGAVQKVVFINGMNEKSADDIKVRSGVVKAAFGQRFVRLDQKDLYHAPKLPKPKPGEPQPPPPPMVTDAFGNVVKVPPGPAVRFVTNPHARCKEALGWSYGIPMAGKEPKVATAGG